MSPAGQLGTDLKPLDPASLESQQLHDVANTEITVSPGSASAIPSNPFDLNSPAGNLNAGSPDRTMMDPTQFGDFAFTYPDLHDAGSIVALGEPEFDDADRFSPQNGSARQHPERQDASMQGLSPIPSFGGGPGNNNAERQASHNPSLDSQNDENSPEVNSLEDAIADEFGLASTGRTDNDVTSKVAKDEKTDRTPSWSELKTKAGKERKRLPLACIACRRKKIRCSGEKPACKHCLRSRIPCVYKVTTRKAAPRTDYMAMLDKRLKRMEERIIKVVPKSEQENVAIQRAVVKPAMPGSLPASASSAKKRGADEAFGHDLDRWARAPSKTKLDGTSKPSAVQIQENEESKLFLEGLDALPTSDIQEHLAEVFFENIYGQAYHILHKPSYMRKLRAGTLPPVLVLSVCAIAARFSTHPKLTSSPNFLRGEEWASHARDICVKRYEWPNITILTCLLILGLHEFGTCHGGRSWALGGQAIRMAFALQLHKDLEHDPLTLDGKTELSFVDREIRRRTMWACFQMDRLNSSGTDRPMFIREETVRIPLPVKEQYFQLDMPAATETLDGEVMHPLTDEDGHMTDAKNNMGVAAYMVRSISLWGRIIHYLNQGGRAVDDKPLWSPESKYLKLIKEADDLLESLPESLSYSADNLRLHNTGSMANQFLFLHISIQQNILFLNRVAVSSPSKSSKQDAPKGFVSRAGTRTFAAADRISDLLKDAESYFVTAPFVGYCAFSSSTIHILGIFSGNPAMEASSKRNLATNVKFLSRMKRYWGMFHWMSENLREQYRAYADAARQGATTNEKATASPIFQYGDWFDRYPHGVSQSDFVDPLSIKKREEGEEAVLEQKPELHTVEEYFTSLSPPQSSEGGRGEGPPRPGQAKRKVVTKKQGGPDRQQVAADPLMADFETGSVSDMGDAGLPQHHQRGYPGSLGGQAAGSAAGYNQLNAPHSHQQSSSAYHAMSPISPMGLGQFGQQHHGGAHHPHHSPFYTPELLSMGLSQQAMASMIQPLDRQMMFGAYSMDPGTGGAMANGSSSLDPIEWERLARSRAQAAEGHRRMPGRMGYTGHGGGGHARHPLDTLAAFGPEASTAWFMPFNMEPPELGHDLGMGMDGLGNMFGGAPGGPASAAGGAGVNGIRHGH